MTTAPSPILALWSITNGAARGENPRRQPRLWVGLDEDAELRRIGSLHRRPFDTVSRSPSTACSRVVGLERALIYSGASGAGVDGAIRSLL